MLLEKYSLAEAFSGKAIYVILIIEKYLFPFSSSFLSRCCIGVYF
jgi:hypothetical protein